MSKVIAEFSNRFEVQIANTISSHVGPDLMGRWEFYQGFEEAKEALMVAEDAASRYRWVRVVDTQNEENA